MNTRVGWIVLLAAASVLGPMLRSSAAGERSPLFRDVVLYELNEPAQIVVDPEKPEQPPQRIATSGLDGKARRGTPLCPEHLTASFDPTAMLPCFPGGPPASESFRGKFWLPLKVHRIAVCKTDRGGVVPIGLHERALGDPTVRVEITFDREIGRAEPARE